ncbi:MAG: DNA polymerase III subunit gamma/tau, partial [Gammaproteobacteria bacterium]|nr:DNA polymerase III subunit gamma/tau [Gammaproteobacteria bacterium]
THGRYKVYLIDEVHMLSKHSFNALLKTLEEPPPHVKFLLATTDPQKLPITVLSRCLQFNLKRLPEVAMREHLIKVLDAEGIPFDEEALDLLSVAADGSLRDALSLVDQAIPFGAGEVRVNEVRDMLGTIDREHVFDLLDALAVSDAEAVLEKISVMDALAPDYAQVLDAMNDILQRMAIAKEVPAALASRTDRKRLLALSKTYSAESIQLFYQIALHGRRDLYLSPTARGGFEMTLLRMLAFEPESSTEVDQKKTLKSTKQKSHSKPATNQAAPPLSAPASASEPVSEAVRTPDSMANDSSVTVNTPGASMATAKTSQNSRTLAARAIGVQHREESEDNPVINTVNEPDEPTSNIQLVPPLQLDDYKAELKITNWIEYYRGLPIKGAVRQLAKHCILGEQGLGSLSLILDADVAPMLSESLKLELQEAICTHEGKSVRLQIIAAEVTGLTPAAKEKQAVKQKKTEAIQAIKDDPFVKALQNRFSARIIERTVKPIKKD